MLFSEAFSCKHNSVFTSSKTLRLGPVIWHVKLHSSLLGSMISGFWCNTLFSCLLLQYLVSGDTNIDFTVFCVQFPQQIIVNYKQYIFVIIWTELFVSWNMASLSRWKNLNSSKRSRIIADADRVIWFPPLWT